MEMNSGDFDQWLSLQRERQEESRQLKQLEQKYRREIKKNPSMISISWETDKGRIHLHNLRSNLSPEFHTIFEDSYTLTWLNLDDLLDELIGNSDKLFPKTKLWNQGNRDDSNITRLIKFSLDGNKFYPPLLNLPGNGIQDGNHRIALSRFLKWTCIPFLVPSDKISNLTHLKCTQI